MADSEPRPGRPTKDLRGEIIQTLEDTDHRAMTIGMLTDEVSGSRVTVKKRIDDLVDAGPVESDKIGNATAYWIPEPEPQVTTPVNGGGGGGNRPDNNPTKRTAGLFGEDRDGMDLPGVMLTLLLAAVAGFVAVELIKTATRRDKIVSDGWTVDVREATRTGAYYAAAGTFALSWLAIGYIGAAYTWSIHPGATVAFVVVFAGLRLVEWRTMRSSGLMEDNS